MSKERLTVRGHKGKTLLKGSSCRYGDMSYDCQFEEGIEKLSAALDKLAEYEDLEEQGLLLRLPCKVGSSVYVIEDDCEYGLGDCYTKQLCSRCEYRNLHIEEEILATERDILLHSKSFGKTVFLTQAEVEEKLRELEGKQNGENNKS